jgi:hypothetical protein
MHAVDRGCGKFTCRPFLPTKREASAVSDRIIIPFDRHLGQFVRKVLVLCMFE